MSNNIQQSNFRSFIDGITASTMLRNRAGEKGCFIEYLCLSASIVDAIIRTGIILKKQIKNRNNIIDTKMCYQRNSMDKITERQIYKNAFDLEVIDKKLFDKLNDVYECRNKAIHRFAFSDICYNDILESCQIYDTIVDELSALLYEIENTQIQEKIGMTVLSEEGEYTKQKLLEEYAKRKIKNDRVYDELRNLTNASTL